MSSVGGGAWHWPCQGPASWAERLLCLPPTIFRPWCSQPVSPSQSEDQWQPRPESSFPALVGEILVNAYLYYLYMLLMKLWTMPAVLTWPTDQQQAGCKSISSIFSFVISHSMLDNYELSLWKHIDHYPRCKGYLAYHIDKVQEYFVRSLPQCSI